MKCPMCRQQVTCLLPLYTRAEERERSNEFGETFGHINNYNRRFSGAPRNVNYYFFYFKINLLFNNQLNSII